MKKDDHVSEERIEQSLEQLPQVKDKRPKEDIYQNIVQRSRTSKQKPAGKWVMPAFSAAAALILLLVLIPNMMTLNNQSGSSTENSSPPEESAETNIQEESSESSDAPRASDSSSDHNTGREEGPADSNEQPQQPEVEKEPAVNTGESNLTYDQYTGALTEAQIEGAQTVATIAVPDPEAELVVPVTFTASADNKAALMEEKNEAWNPGRVGLAASSFENVDWIDGGDNSLLEADFSDAETPAGSTQSEMIVKSLDETLRYTEENQVLLTDDGRAGVDLGNYGIVENYRQKENNRGYYIYTSETNDQFLVSQQAAGMANSHENGELFTLKETLEQMKSVPENSPVGPSIPEEASIESAGGESGTAEVVFSEESSIGEAANLRWMIESILFTAADFGYEQVRFQGITPENSGGYPVEEPVAIPEAPNFIE
ncbi:GerMN domain-containing protein [Salibacterium qingdaonense]|uniref:Sporulation and spore germination n=1 Tax=Salibacterium qingdaonense TaxID=266892 RepID=A0A1I4I9D6_9BACI|nr:GerMN domain-containing protein [Salibacterium qingdaonense]SFL50371.1 Sporulation and spore germination [Salibacterium qingdaonense]